MSKTKYKINEIDKIQITAASRQALITADSHYFAWSAEQQQHFRATMDEASRTKVQRVLLDSLLNIQCSNEKVNEAWDDVPMSKLNILNWASLLTSGIGEDYLYLNESMAEDKSLLDFTTLYDYDFHDYLFQEEANFRDVPNYEGANYFAYRHSSWVRLLINDQFYYATFFSLATHLIDKIEEAGDDIIEQLLPHKYIEGKENGKPEKGGFLWDMQLDAGGQEGQLEELKSRWYSYLKEQWTILSKINVANSAAVYSQEMYWDEDPHRIFIFNNEAALKEIRWQHFLSDCKPLMDNYSTVTNQLEQAINSAKEFLTENHRDIQTNFDPNIIKLQKNRKIIMTAEAMDDLDKMSNEDEPKK